MNILADRRSGQSWEINQKIGQGAMAETYEYLKLQQAVTLLAASHKQLRWRIYDAWDAFNTVHVPNLPPRAQQIYAEIEAAITAVMDGDERYGAVRNTLERISPKRAKALASLIVDLLVASARGVSDDPPG